MVLAGHLISYRLFLGDTLQVASLLKKSRNHETPYYQADNLFSCCFGGPVLVHVRFSSLTSRIERSESEGKDELPRTSVKREFPKMHWVEHVFLPSMPHIRVITKGNPCVSETTSSSNQVGLGRWLPWARYGSGLRNGEINGKDHGKASCNWDDNGAASTGDSPSISHSQESRSGSVEVYNSSDHVLSNSESSAAALARTHDYNKIQHGEI